MEKKWRHFQGKKVYITGGSSGIGLAAAKRMAVSGADVLILARDESRLRQAVETIRASRRSGKENVACTTLDVEDPITAVEVLDRSAVEFGPPDILINSAGHARPDYFENISAADFDAAIKLNLYGIRNVTAAALRHMGGPHGYIVNVSSLAGLMGVFGYTAYSASKFAVIGFSEALRAELKPRGITVSVLCPPDTDTPGLAAENVTKPRETKAVCAGAGTLTADTVARDLVRGMVRKKFLIIPGRQARLTVLAKRLCPGLVERVMNRAVSSCYQG